MAGLIDASTVRHVAKLARLKLTDEEVERFAGQLGQILEYVRQLDAVDASGVEPLAHPLPIVNVLRDDQPRPGLSSEDALRNAPDRHGGFFRVPAVLEGE